MNVVSFAAWPLAANIAVFAPLPAACGLLVSGRPGYAQIIAERTGADQAFVGILLLGALVSLPEMATTVAAATLLTTVYLAGFVERRHKATLRMGIDSLIVLVAYSGGLVVLFFLR